MSIGCLDFPQFPLQLAQRAEPGLRACVTVVVDEDRAQGRVLWACERAHAHRISVGMRLTVARTLCPELRAVTVSQAQLTAAIDELRVALHELSPGVEPAEEPGTFWLAGDGLRNVFGTPAAWAAEIARAAEALGYRCAVVFGSSRFATFAIARGRGPGIHVMRSAREEREAARDVRLDRLELAPKLRAALERLGVTTLGQMVRLPGGGILERFGSDAYRMYQLAAGERWDPIAAVPPPESLGERVLLDDDELDIERLLFPLKGALDRLLARLAAQVRALTALHVELTLKHAVGKQTAHLETIKPAEPTLDARVLVRLVKLRLEAAQLAAPVCELRLSADHILATREQLALFKSQPRRDPRAANEAIAALRAELGEHAVVRAVIRDGHLPEATFAWEPITHVVPARPTGDGQLRLFVRRIRTRPRRLPAQSRHVRDDGWLLSGLEQGAVVRLHGPYIISGGWWGSAEPVRREYFFADMRRGDTLWVYFDRVRYRWFEHGTIE